MKDTKTCRTTMFEVTYILESNHETVIETFKTEALARAHALNMALTKTLRYQTTVELKEVEVWEESLGKWTKILAERELTPTRNYGGTTDGAKD